ncbi:MAG: response regulator transcription factor [Chryseolinea sp.]
MSILSVLLADNQPLTAAGLNYILRDRNDIRIIAEVKTQRELPEMVRLHRPDLLIVDYNAPGYVTKSDLADVKSYSPGTNILAISSDDNKANILQVLQAGVHGYLTKECSKEEIIMAVAAVGRGEKFFCHKILDIIMQKHFPQEAEIVPGILTMRETEILKLLASGYSTQKVADELFLSPHTVHTHRKSIIKKLNIKSPTEFVIYALDFGLIKPK